ncbi:Urease accessory protein [Candidatus Methylobacter favarea]|uniref:Urease accessory protein n=1 Tax=Candidatus Methylobacter favarea TaxID=2707345 RepID=A0A8S0X7M0_9GAMM|nr:HupE/UreJ family protein [Candidatus Methylobacter favarea]CAA9890197.1 Urease accessory protein [Candidatus Methylobacter favarea]
MRFKYWSSMVLCLASPALYAHSGEMSDNGFLSGLLHPLTGADHLLVLIAVGICAAKQGGKAIILFPGIFLALMSAGALMRSYAVHIPFIELLITVSVMVFGLLASVNQKQLSGLFFSATAFFAVFHGYAHAAEIPQGAPVISYFSALLLMSLMICMSGILLGLSTGKRANYLFSLTCLSSGLYFLAAG